MQKCNWESIECVFEALNGSDLEYVILRNYEEIYDDNFYMPGHGDIDFLTNDRKNFVKIIRAYPRFDADDGVHYKVLLKGSEIIVDIRSVGDDYYDKNFEKSILKNRCLKDSHFFIPCDEDSYYSLVYHAILQKKELTFEYLDRLNKMASALGLKALVEKDHLLLLDEFMKKHHFYYTAPFDIHVPLRRTLVDSSIYKKRLKVTIRDLKISILRFACKIKRSIFFPRGIS